MFRLRAPWLLDPEGYASASVAVVDEWSPVVVRVGASARPISLPVDGAWALWRVLGESLASLRDAPEWVEREVGCDSASSRRLRLSLRRPHRHRAASLTGPEV